MDQSGVAESRGLQLIIKVFLGIPGLFLLYIVVGIIGLICIAQNIQLNNYEKQTVVWNESGYIVMEDWRGESCTGLVDREGKGRLEEIRFVFDSKEEDTYVYRPEKDIFKQSSEVKNIETEVEFLQGSISLLEKVVHYHTERMRE